MGTWVIIIHIGGSLCICFRGFLYGGGVHQKKHVFLHFFHSSDQIPSFLLRTVSDFFRFQFCSEKQQNEKKYWFFSVSLELRCVLGFWENHPDHLWFWPNFLERNFNLIWTVSDFPIFYRFQFCSKKPKKIKKIMFFSVSLELRCVLGFWENYPDRLWFLPNFLERNFNLIWTVSDFQSFYRFQFCSKKPKKRSRKIMFFSVSLELRCVLGFWESYRDRLWFVPNFLERSFNLIWTVSDFQSFTDSSFAEVLWQSTLSHIFW